MSEADLKKIKKYLESRAQTGEEGFWIAPFADSYIKKSNTAFDDLKNEVIKCRRCQLGKYRIKACFGEGNQNAEILFIGEGPGYEEDHSGIVFVGRAGKLLDKIIKEVLGFDRSRIYITNIVKCHPMKDPLNPEKRGNDRPPDNGEICSCMPYLTEQIRIIRPKVIVTLGSPSSKTILNTSKGISGIRGKVFNITIADLPVKVVPVYHPAYLLRSPGKSQEMYEDMKTIGSLL
ncbi:uracil-DNA glycosylase [Elusimicrobiota bacterium]